MKVIKFLFVFCFCFICFISSVDALICDNADVSRLKELANKVEANYEYIPESDGEESIVNAYLLDIVNLTDELYVVIGGYDYYYNDVKEGVLSILVNSGDVSIDVYSTRCKDILLRNISLKLPKFNTYSYRSECENLDIDICDEWYQGYLNDEIFSNKIAKYLKDDKEDNLIDEIFNFLDKYSVYIIGGVLVIILITVAILIQRKRGVLD